MFQVENLVKQISHQKEERQVSCNECANHFVGCVYVISAVSLHFISEFVYTLVLEYYTCIDNLMESNLIVGKKYSYCVRAINQFHYMDHPFDLEGMGRTLTSSDNVCSGKQSKFERLI